MSSIQVRFSNRAEQKLTEGTCKALKPELGAVFSELNAPQAKIELSVADVLAGHSVDAAAKVVLAVEAKVDGSYVHHIVKLGRAEEVKPDYDGWMACTAKRMIASRIFSPVQYVELPGESCAVVYRDAYTLFGPDEKDEPHSLEEVVGWSVADDKPDPASVERAMAHIFTDLSNWFYPGARANAKDSHEFYAERLRLKAAPADGSVLQMWERGNERRELRRHAVWILAGRDLPDADPVQQPARYLDPVEYIRWAMADPIGNRIPESLVGRSHGDLHGRNILLGVRRGEADYPAVFDYGEMSPANVLAWDFAKLETELKAHILPEVLQDRDAMARLLGMSELRNSTTSGNQVGVPTPTSHRADLLRACLAFEEVLHKMTCLIDAKAEAERIEPLCDAPTGNQKLDRLCHILFRIRREAAICLGLPPADRLSLWRDELYFALGVYGTLNVKWNYPKRAREAAIVSAGVAVAHLDRIPALLSAKIDEPLDPVEECASYRIPLAQLHRLWKSGNDQHSNDHQKAMELAREVVLCSSYSDAETIVQARWYHAMPLIGEVALLMVETGNLAPVEQLLAPFRPLAIEFGDFETLARLGRLFKEAGDVKWEREIIGGNHFQAAGQSRVAWRQMYDKAYAIYAEAFEATDDYYVGINAATLALLTGKNSEAKKHARQVRRICESKLDHQKADRYWLLATEGEAATILAEPASSILGFYEAAMDELLSGQWNMANSSYKQACRLWRILEEDQVEIDNRVVEPVLKFFEQSEAGPYLQPVLGRSPVERINALRPESDRYQGRTNSG